MQGIKRDLDLDEKRSIARRAEIEFVRELTYAPVVEALALPGVEMWATPANWAYVNGVYLARDAREDEDAIEQAIDFFARNAITHYMLWWDEAIDIESWRPYLERHGFTYDVGSPLLVLDMDDGFGGAPLLNGFRVQRVGDIAGLDLWARISAAGFTMTPEITEDKIELWTSYGLDGPMEFYIGFLGEEAVTTAAVHYTQEVADLVVISTLPHARGKGYGGAVTRAAALAGRAKGYRYAVLSASPLGKPVYERLGFVEVGNLDNYNAPSL